MKNEIPPRTTSAPIAIPIAPPPLIPLPPAVVLVGAELTSGVVGVVVDVVLGDWGRPGDNGLPGDCASAVAGRARNTPARISNRKRARTTLKNFRQASGFSIAGVSGALTYGCSSSTCSSW